MPLAINRRQRPERQVGVGPHQFETPGIDLLFELAFDRFGLPSIRGFRGLLVADAIT